MLTGYKFRLYPEKDQEQVLLRWVGCQRLIYNGKVQEDRYFRRFAQRMVGTVGIAVPLDQRYSQFITEDTAFLRDFPSQVLRNGAVRFRQAYSRFHKGLSGRPKIKRKAGRQSVWLTAELFRFVEANPAQGVSSYELHIGNTKFPVDMCVIQPIARMRCPLPSTFPSSAASGGYRFLPKILRWVRLRIRMPYESELPPTCAQCRGLS